MGFYHVANIKSDSIVKVIKDALARFTRKLQLNSEIKVLIIGFLSQINKFECFCGLFLCERLYRMLGNVSKAL